MPVRSRCSGSGGRSPGLASGSAASVCSSAVVEFLPVVVSSNTDWSGAVSPASSDSDTSVPSSAELFGGEGVSDGCAAASGAGALRARDPCAPGCAQAREAGRVAQRNIQRKRPTDRDSQGLTGRGPVGRSRRKGMRTIEQEPFQLAEPRFFLGVALSRTHCGEMPHLWQNAPTK